jgi:hypothetical protein
MHPPAVEIVENAPDGACHREVDADVVQGKAPPDIGLDLHLAPPFGRHRIWHHCVASLYGG